MNMATELTPLNGDLTQRHTKTSVQYLYTYYIQLSKHIWNDIATYAWRCLLFIAVLVVVNTLLRSFFSNKRNLVFSSSPSNFNDNDFRAISDSSMPPNIMWITTDMSADDAFLSDLKKQSITITLASSGDSESELPSLSLDEFVRNGYYVRQLSASDDIEAVALDTPFLVTLLSLTARQLEAKLDTVISRLHSDTKISQNLLMVLGTRSSFLLYGASIPTKRRGSSISDVVLVDDDLQSLLLHFSDQNERGSTLWRQNYNIYE